MHLATILLVSVFTFFLVIFVRLLKHVKPGYRSRPCLLVAAPAIVIGFLGLAIGTPLAGAVVGFSLGTAFLHFLTHAKLGPM